MSNLQRDYDVNYKGTKQYLKVHPWQKFLAIGGLGAAAYNTIFSSGLIVNTLELAGQIGGGIALANITNAKSSVFKSAFLLVGGLALSGVANLFPLTTLLHQVTGTIATAGLTGLVQIGSDALKRRNKY